MFATLTADLDDPESFDLEVWPGSPSRRSMRGWLMGTPTQLPSFDEVSLWVGADSRVAPLGTNHIAQRIWQKFGGPSITGVADASNVILGNLVICGPLLTNWLGMGWVQPLTQQQVDQLISIGEPR